MMDHHHEAAVEVTGLTQAIDVLILGAGAAGLSAALAASAAGARVVVAERSSFLGGSLATSAGIVWVPVNDHAKDLDGRPDTFEAAMAYLRAGSGSRLEHDRAAHFVRTGGQTVRFLQDEAGVPFQPLSYPDFYPDLPGAMLAGRSLEAPLFESESLGDVAGLIQRRGRNYPAVLISERGRVPSAEQELRQTTGQWALGAALAGYLVRACLRQGVRFLRNVRATRLERSADRVFNVWVSHEASTEPQDITLAASRVVLATGGFEWNGALVRSYLHPPVAGAVSPPGNEGDGLSMALDAGAAVGEMAEAWWAPMIEIENGNGQPPLFIPAVGERARRHCIMVNQAGRRFVNEARNYADVALAIQTEQNPARFPNDPCWMIMDGNCSHSGMYGGLRGAHHEWLRPYPSLAELATDQRIDAAGLERTVANFNLAASAGFDPEFGRGQSPYDIYLGDGPAADAFATLGALDTPPFYAVRLHSGVFGTHGGPRVDLDGRMLDATGTPIPGLYAAGNVAAGMFGAFYPGPGATLGPAIVGGCQAGAAAANSVLRDGSATKGVR